MQLDPLRRHQPSRLVGVERCTPSGDAAQPAIEQAPVGGSVALGRRAVAVAVVHPLVDVLSVIAS
ncbi:MAG: hypothetical protein KC464_14430, partial [Myxococcales bacterium]|nr:hypothetical protein [Myxococcales bacterium]